MGRDGWDRMGRDGWDRMGLEGWDERDGIGGIGR